MNKICPLLSIGVRTHSMNCETCQSNCVFFTNDNDCVLAKAAAIYVYEHTPKTAYEPKEKVESTCGFTF